MKTRSLRFVAAVGMLFACLALVPTSVAAGATSAACASQPGTSTGSDGWTATEPLTRNFYDASGATSTSNCFQLTVSKHTDLQDHERITVNWSGAHVTGGRSLFPYGEQGLPQEYPVVLMECRGVDPQSGAAVPSGAEQVSPSTCWTSTYFQRTNSAGNGAGIWEQDATGHDNTQHLQGIDPALVPADCNLNASSDYLVTPFKGVDGTVYPGCSSSTMPPGATVSSVSIPNEAYGFTSSDGTGTYSFEALTGDDKAALGCSYQVACTLEVIPIDGINCDNTDPNAACNQTGILPPGKVNPGTAPQDAVAPAFWASASNWDRRVAVPLTFAKPRSVCTLSTAGQPVPFFGTELLGQAAIQWTPAYCLNKNRFNWQENSMSEDGAYGLMESGTAAAAEVMSRTPGDSGVAYAPTAVTGWGIGFTIDKANNLGQQTSLHLTPLLLAKLLTESYPGSTLVGQSHPGFSTNPLSLNLDPDFTSINPGLDQAHWSEAAATLLATTTSSQAMYQLTSYIASDPAAMAFINGKAEADGPYTMQVNPAYKGMKLPVTTWPLLDTWQNKTTNNACLGAQGKAMPPYMPLIANPVSDMATVVQALTYSWPNVQTGCSGNGSPQSPYQLGRVATQGMGSRFMLGMVTLGDAARYGIPLASLQTTPGNFVTADNAGLAAALKLAKPTGPLLPFALDQSAIRKSATAYPGTEVIYTAAKTSGLPAKTAKDVAQFISVSSTEGQIPGRGNGQLPEGFLPITKSGVTAALYAQDVRAQAVIAAQKAPKTSTPGGTSNTGSGAGNGGSTSPTGSPVGGTKPAAVTALTPKGSVPPATSLGNTQLVSSSVGGSLLPILLSLGLVAGLASLGLRGWITLRGVR